MASLRSGATRCAKWAQKHLLDVGDISGSANINAQQPSAGESSNQQRKRKSVSVATAAKAKGRRK